jgi:hypothetical protein
MQSCCAQFSLHTDVLAAALKLIGVEVFNETEPNHQIEYDLVLKSLTNYSTTCMYSFDSVILYTMNE